MSFLRIDFVKIFPDLCVTVSRTCPASSIKSLGKEMNLVCSGQDRKKERVGLKWTFKHPLTKSPIQHCIIELAIFTFTVCNSFYWTFYLCGREYQLLPALHRRRASPLHPPSITNILDVQNLQSRVNF